MTPVGTAEAAAIERGVAAVEARTGVQIVAAVVPRSDTYPELAWRAFALGTSFAALLALMIDWDRRIGCRRRGYSRRRSPSSWVAEQRAS